MAAPAIILSPLGAGSIWAYAVTSDVRLASAPDIPTAAEAGLPGYEMTTWFGFLAPSATDKARINYLNAEFQKVLDRPETQKRFEGLGVIANGGSAAEFEATIQEDAKTYKPIVAAAGVTVE